ncbi:MAG: ABC transporter ATP-binding protein [Candidatus Berkiella sp.]
MTIIKALNVYKSISTLASPIDILKGVNLQVNEGESIAIVGASGSGKTTLLSLLAGLDTPTQGEIIVDGQILSSLTEDKRTSWRLGRIGFVFQNFELLPALSALENVMLPLELCGIKDAKNLAKTSLAQVNLQHRLSHFPHQLSGGEQQRVAIARSFAISPKILFADEPTGSLDVSTGDATIEILYNLQKQHKTTLVFVTHDINLGKRCGSIFELESGILRLKQES